VFVQRQLSDAFKHVAKELAMVRRRKPDREIEAPCPLSALPLVLGPPSSAAFEAATFVIESEEYLVLSFPSPSETASPSPAVLTGAERDVIQHVVNGRSNYEIAHARKSSPRTIANQISGIYRKLGVRSRRELAARRGQLEVPLP
jgi:DNA-binding CsgD family transcriptional regulator